MATSQDVINAAYVEALGRPADPDGLSFYAGQLESGAKSVGDIIADLNYAAATGVEDKATNQAVTASGGWDFASPSGGGGGGGGSTSISTSTPTKLPPSAYVPTGTYRGGSHKVNGVQLVPGAPGYDAAKALPIVKKEIAPYDPAVVQYLKETNQYDAATEARVNAVAANDARRAELARQVASGKINSSQAQELMNSADAQLVALTGTLLPSSNVVAENNIAGGNTVTPLTAQDLYNQFLGGRPALDKDYRFWNNYITQYGPEQATAAFEAAAQNELGMDLAARADSLREQNLSRDGTVMTDGERTVREGALTAQGLYNEFLGGRTALPEDISYWNNYIAVYGPDKARAAFDAAAKPEREMPVEDLVKSLRAQNLTVPGSLLGRFETERKATPAEVRSMYLSVLGREPDPEGFTFWTSQPVENLRQLFYKGGIPEMEKRVAAIPVTTAIPKPVIGQVSPQSRGQSVDIPGSFVTTPPGPPKPLTVDISTMPREQQDLTSFIVGKMPRPTTTAPGPMFTPGEVNAQLELERLKAMNAPRTTNQGPVAGFAEGGLVGNDINRMLQNQRNAIQRESQSRRMLTNLGAPPVKKFSDGGPAGSSSGVRRLEMSKIRKRQEGSPPVGEVTNDEFIQEMMTGTRPTDQEVLVERTSDVFYKTPKSQELANQVRALFQGQGIEAASPSAKEDYLKRRPTPESREPIRSRKAMEAFLKAANPRMEIEERPLPGGRLGFVRADDPDTLVLSTRQFPAQREETAFHELEHSLSERGGNPLGKLRRDGEPMIMDNNYRFDVLYNKKNKVGGEGAFVRHDIIKRMVDNRDKIEEFFGRPIDSDYFSEGQYDFQKKSGSQGALLAEQIADLSALEQVTNKSLTRDPKMRKLLFPDDKAAAVYDAITGLRQTRLDAKDLPPYTPVFPEEKGMMDLIKEKLGMGKK